MEDLKKQGQINVVEYDPCNKQDLVKNFKGHDVVCIIPPVVQKKHHHGGGGHRGDEDEEQVKQMSEWLRQSGQNMIDATHEAGVKCAILMSHYMSEKAEHGGRGGRGEDPAMTRERGKHGRMQLLKVFHELEQHFQRSRIQNKCAIKSSLLMQTFLLYARQVQSQGVMPLATGDGKFAPISIRDISRFVVCLLSGKKRPEHGGGDRDRPNQDWRRLFNFDAWTVDPEAEPMSPQHRGKCYNLTGHELVTGAELVERASEAVGARIKHKQVSLEDACNLLKESGMIEEMEIKLLIEIYCCIAHGHHEEPCNDFEKVTGRKPMSVEEFFQDHASDFKPSK